MHRNNTYVPNFPLRDHGSPLILDDNGRRRIWFLSVRHSGTHYLFRHLDRLKCSQAYIDWLTRSLKTKSPYPTYFIHSHVEVDPIYQHVLTDPCIFGLRNPVEVFKSHCYRYSWPQDMYEPYILSAFEIWTVLRDRYDSYVFKVDSEDQEQEVARLAKWLDIDEYNYCYIGTTELSTRDKPGTHCHCPSLFENPPLSIRKLASELGY